MKESELVAIVRGRKRVAGAKYLFVHVTLLVISSVEEDCVGISKFHGVEGENDFHVLRSAVDKITVEQENIRL